MQRPLRHTISDEHASCHAQPVQIYSLLASIVNYQIGNAHMFCPPFHARGLPLRPVQNKRKCLRRHRILSGICFHPRHISRHMHLAICEVSAVLHRGCHDKITTDINTVFPLPHLKHAPARGLLPILSASCHITEHIISLNPQLPPVNVHVSALLNQIPLYRQFMSLQIKRPGNQRQITFKALFLREFPAAAALVGGPVYVAVCLQILTRNAVFRIDSLFARV